MQLMITSGVEFPASRLQAIFEAGKSIKVSTHRTCMSACSLAIVQHAAASARLGRIDCRHSALLDR